MVNFNEVRISNFDISHVLGAVTVFSSLDKDASNLVFGENDTAGLPGP